MATPHSLVTTPLLAAVRAKYRLPWLGTHGVTHWARVLENGRRLAEATGANREVVELFAVLHDARRQNENHDPEHGRRGADLARELRGAHFDLADADFERLIEACAYHADGLTSGDATVSTCWDADRLDLGRVGIRPDPRYLCTPAARDPGVLQWAWRRSQSDRIPRLAQDEWEVDRETGAIGYAGPANDEG